MAKKELVEAITISPPNFEVVALKISGTAPYMQCRFSKKALEKMRATHAEGSRSRKGKAKEARDFDADYEGAKHISTEGWIGIPAGSLRNASIDACRAAGFKMTHAKMSIFIEADGFDEVDGTPLIKINGKPEKTEMTVRNATGVVDIRVRPMWREWSANVKVRFDADQFTAKDVINLLARAGMQVGIGEGRPFSKQSNGLGFGLFKVEGSK